MKEIKDCGLLKKYKPESINDLQDLPEDYKAYDACPLPACFAFNLENYIINHLKYKKKGGGYIDWFLLNE